MDFGRKDVLTLKEQALNIRTNIHKYGVVVIKGIKLDPQ